MGDVKTADRQVMVKTLTKIIDHFSDLRDDCLTELKERHLFRYKDIAIFISQISSLR